MTDKQKAFIEKVAPLVQKYAPKYGICTCSPVIAQAILESGWGESKLSKLYFNFFGMKCGSKWTGRSVNLTTSEEYTPGTKTVIKDYFRVYDSLEDGIHGYFEFIQLQRYQGLRGITDPRSYLEAIKAAGYATASDYVESNMKIIEKCNLTKYDKHDQEVEQVKWKTVESAISALELAEKAEEGYLEKRDKTPKYLDHKTKNAGSDNYTKYWRDINAWRLFKYADGWAGGAAWYWCAAFQYWCFVMAFGKEAAEKLLLHSPFISCATLAAKSKAAKQLHKVPKRGDVALFWKGKKFGHTGLVILVDKKTKTFWTIEGNTSGASGVISNGGGVVVGKKYSYDGTEHRFHRPEYAAVLGISDKTAETPVATVNTAQENIAAGQRWLNANYKKILKEVYGSTLKVSGEYDTATRNAALTVWKDVMNRKHGTKLNPRNHNFLVTCRGVADKAKVSANSAGTFTLIAQLILSAKGFYHGAMDAACGAVMVQAITDFQKAQKLTADGMCGKKTWDKLFN